MTPDQLNWGMVIVLLAVLCGAAGVWISPRALAHLAARCMARRHFLLEGRKAQDATMREWEAIKDGR